jgi:NADP-dependent 3-hydroxy acid dehydrogenase YdfG
MNKKSRFGQMDYNFEDHVVIVTGATRGIGNSLVKAFVASGAEVIDIDRDSNNLSKLNNDN